MCNKKSNFTDLTPYEEVVQVGNNQVLTLLGIEMVEPITVVDGFKHFLNLKNVLYAPDIMNYFKPIS